MTHSRDGSQDNVYELVRTRSLALVWGPPGSGKTYFLSAAICRLLISSYLDFPFSPKPGLPRTPRQGRESAVPHTKFASSHPSCPSSTLPILAAQVLTELVRCQSLAADSHPSSVHNLPF